MHVSKPSISALLLLACTLFWSCEPKDSPRPNDDALASGSNAYAAQNTYMITTRFEPDAVANGDSVPDVYPMPDGRILFYQSNHPLDSNPSNFDTVPAADFLSNLGADLEAVTVNDTAQVTIFIHGLATAWDTAKKNVGVYGKNLYDYGYDNGVVVGFSWPAYTTIPDLSSFGSGILSGLDTIKKQLGYYSDSYLQSDSSGSIRANINGSTAGFKNMLDTLFSLKNGGYDFKTLQVNIVAHSEGNYMLMLGMNSIFQSPVGLPKGDSLDQVLMMAADIDNAALQAPTVAQDPKGTQGDGGSIAELSRQVTVYYSTHDYDMWSSSVIYLSTDILFMPPLHNPLHNLRLGYTGPWSIDSLQPNVIAVNCGQVNNPARMDSLLAQGVYLPDTSVHTSYLHVPDLLADEAAVLMGKSAPSISHRIMAALGSTSGELISSQYCIVPDSVVVGDTTCLWQQE